MPQERYNTTWMEGKKLGKVIASVNELPQAAAAILSDLPNYEQHVQDIGHGIARQLSPSPIDHVVSACEFQEACIKAANKTTHKIQFVTMLSNL